MSTKTSSKHDEFLKEIQAAIPREEVTVPGVKRKLYIQALSARDARKLRDDFPFADPENPTDAEAEEFMLVCIAASTFTARGSRWVPSGSEQALMSLTEAQTTALVTTFNRVNGYTADDDAGN